MAATSKIPNKSVKFKPLSAAKFLASFFSKIIKSASNYSAKNSKLPRILGQFFPRDFPASDKHQELNSSKENTLERLACRAGLLVN